MSITWTDLSNHAGMVCTFLDAAGIDVESAMDQAWCDGETTSRNWEWDSSAAEVAKTILKAFIGKYGDLVEQALDEDGYDPCDLAADLYLSATGHGVGFWDRGFPGTLGDDLTDAAVALLMYVDVDVDTTMGVATLTS